MTQRSRHTHEGAVTAKCFHDRQKGLFSAFKDQWKRSVGSVLTRIINLSSAFYVLGFLYP